MSEETFSQLDELQTSGGAKATIERLIAALREEKQFHKLFDAICLQKKFELGLPLTRPTSFDDVPDEQQDEFKASYVCAAREAGELLLADGDIPEAWMYLRTIGEPEKVAAALDAIDSGREVDEQTEQLINIALYEGANPVKGLEMMLRSHGTCNTVTALDQQIQELKPENRKQAACLLVNEIFGDLCQTVQSEVEQRMALAPPGDSLRELITGRDWLFADDNYHVDVSHLNAVVRFSRFLDSSCPELQKAIQLAEYGANLSPQFHYAGDPPFDDFYPAHVQFFKALADESRDDAIGYFREKLDAEPDEEDKPMLAYVLVDLLTRVDRSSDAVDVAEKYLKDVEDPNGFSFAELCQQAGRLDVLQNVAREKGDLVAYTAALVQ
jgi:hypothetical protein